MKRITGKYPAVPYIAPLAILLLFLGLKDTIPVSPLWQYAGRTILTSAILVLVSWRWIPWRPSRPPSRPWMSLGIGVVVFAVWIMPDVLWPQYRAHWLFQNSLTGEAASSIPGHERSSLLLLLFRVFGSVVLVPIVEELFWRGWLIRYIVNPDFQSVRIGTYTPLAFWLTAVLFASEHGPFWDVGLVAGILYNWWAGQTGKLADCILAHAVTNGCLAVYVLGFGQWEYWL